MKNYTITVNGVAYDVTVEENGQGTAPAAPVRPAAAPKAAPKAPAAAPKAAAGAGSIKIEAGAAGKVFKIERKVGDSVKITDGPFSGFDGTVDEIAVDRSKIKVIVMIFGRKTLLELNFNQVTKE